MKYDIEELRALEERLAATSGPDRRIDADMHVLLFQKPNEHYIRPFRYPILLAQEHQWPGILEYVDISGVSAVAAEKFTASVDASAMLCDRVLRGWFWDVTSTGQAWVQSEDSTHHWSAEAKTPACALCLATVRALIAGAP